VGGAVCLESECENKSVLKLKQRNADVDGQLNVLQNYIKDESQESGCKRHSTGFSEVKNKNNDMHYEGSRVVGFHPRRTVSLDKNTGSLQHTEISLSAATRPPELAVEHVRKRKPDHFRKARKQCRAESSSILILTMSGKYKFDEKGAPPIDMDIVPDGEQLNHLQIFSLSEATSSDKSCVTPIERDNYDRGAGGHRPLETATKERGFVRTVSGKRKINSVRMIFVLFLAFFFTYLPFIVVNMSGNNAPINRNWYMITSLAFWAGSCVNPIIYGIMNKQFRDAYISIVMNICVSRSDI